VRKAGKLADLALKAGVDETRAGADEGRILAAQQAAIFAGGGDYRATNSSSARARMRSSAATRPGGESCRDAISSLSNSPASTATIMPP
jgi:hypothetical protein